MLEFRSNTEFPDKIRYDVYTNNGIACIGFITIEYRDDVFAFVSGQSVIYSEELIAIANKLKELNEAV